MIGGAASFHPAPEVILAPPLTLLLQEEEAKQRARDAAITEVAMATTSGKGLRRAAAKLHALEAKLADTVTVRRRAKGKGGASADASPGADAGRGKGEVVEAGRDNVLLRNLEAVLRAQGRAPAVAADAKKAAAESKGGSSGGTTTPAKGRVRGSRSPTKSAAAAD